MNQEKNGAVQDASNKPWFVAKSYGWGWTPATWQGWLILAIFIAVIVLNLLRIDAYSESINTTLLHFIPQTFVLIAILILICWKKGEKPRWQWGESDKNKKM